MKKPKKIIAFDADDTLFINETYFTEAESKLINLLKEYSTKKEITEKLYHTQINNLKNYGYGIKGYTLTMIQIANELLNNKITPEIIDGILNIGREMLKKPIELIDGVEDVLKKLSTTYTLIVVTKGDLKDQHRKLNDSGLKSYFYHIEVMIEKNEADYKKLFKQLEIDPQDFYMVGNSLKSDIVPVLNLGGTAIHIPFTTTWAHEDFTEPIVNDNFHILNSIKELKNHNFATFKKIN